MHRRAAVNLALACTQAATEGFQIVVGAVALGPAVARKEPRPALPEGGADMRDHLGVVGVVPGVLFQVRQEVLDLAFETAPRGAWLAIFRRGEPPLQLDQPVPLAPEMPRLRCKWVATLDHGHQLRQEGMAPFSWLRFREASSRAKSSKTRRPPRAKGGLLLSVRGDRSTSA